MHTSIICAIIIQHEPSICYNYYYRTGLYDISSVPFAKNITTNGNPSIPIGIKPIGNYKIPIEKCENQFPSLVTDRTKAIKI